MGYNGAAMLAMTGKDCVAIATDTRLGMQAQTITTDFQKVFQMNDKLFVGLAGLASDVQSLAQLLKYKMKMYAIKEEREMAPSTFANMLSTTLYEKRFGPWFAEPIVAGIGKDGKPFVAAMDLIGAPVSTVDFVVGGTCSQNLYGLCESMYRPDLSPDELFETAAQCLLSSFDRDAVSGWGAVVHVISATEVVTRHLKARQD